MDDPDVWLRATCAMQDIENFIARLIDKGHAYATPEGDVYFAVDSFPGYGKLSGRNLEDARESVRIETRKTSAIRSTSRCGSPQSRASPSGTPRGGTADRAGTSNAPR